MNEKILVIFSGGQDSTTCLLQAIATCGAPQVETITFCYGQRHAIELECARRIAADLQVRQTVLDIPQLQAVTHNALIDENAAITQGDAACRAPSWTGATPCSSSMRRFMPKGAASAAS